MQDNQRRKRAVIYCRVSTDKQEQDGASLDYQEEKCTQYAKMIFEEIESAGAEIISFSEKIDDTFSNTLTPCKQH